MRRMGQDDSARRMFDEAFQNLEQRCFRDARDLRRFKAMIWGKVKSLHNVTHMEHEECTQIILEIVDKGCQNFYRTQHEELMKYCNPTPEDKPKKPSMAKLSTFIYGHVDMKYNSLMTGFFAPIRAFEAGRVRTEVTEKLGIDKDGSVARALAEGRIKLPDGVQLRVDDDKVITKVSPGTIGLQRHDIHGPGCPVLEYGENEYSRRPDLMAMLSEFIDEHRGAIELITMLGDARPCPEGLKGHFGTIAESYGLPVNDFIKAVRGIFSENQSLQNV